MKRKFILPIIIVFVVGIFGLFNLRVEEHTLMVKAKTFTSATPTYINRIDINYDTTKVRISPAYTYREVMDLFESEWSFPEDSHSDKGNNNIYINTCPSSTKCMLEEATRPEYDEDVYANRYHWVLFEVYTRDCAGGSASCDYDYDKNHLDQIEVWLNGVKVEDAVVVDYNSYWHEVDVYIPINSYNGPLVKSINITSPTDYVQKGTTSEFTAYVSSYGAGTGNITWSVTDKSSSNTKISSSGVLTVGADETSERITVRATSTYDNTIYGEKKINVIAEPLSITSVSIAPRDYTVVYGGYYQFDVEVVGTANHDVTWSLTGANKSGTEVDEYGLLTVAPDETATSLQLTATSVADNTKHDTVTVHTRQTEIISKIEINYDTSQVVFSNRTTYNQVRRKIEKLIQYPVNAGYDEGNENVWFDFCPSNTPCSLDDVNGGYEENMLLDRYTYMVVEVFAKPSDRAYMANPLYDFDSAHLDQIEVWVNGVKRDDAFVNGYNSAWREVDVFIPITVTNDKLNQEFEFNYDEYSKNYGALPFKNSILDYSHVGDGEITYESSDTSVATVDNEGYVTVKKVGTCTITAHASETDDYLPYSNSYTVTVNPKYVWPTISGYESSYTYTGSQITPEVTVTYDDITLVKDVDYTITYGENTNYGPGTITLSPVVGSNYTFSDSYGASFYIDKREITNSDVTLEYDKITDDGTVKEPTVTVVVNGKTLVKDTDYSVSYSSNSSVGTAYVYITGIGNYMGNPYKTFEIIEEPNYIKGDMNGNGKIDLADIISLLKKYLSGDATDHEISVGDMDDNGSIGLRDIILLLKLYLEN